MDKDVIPISMVYKTAMNAADQIKALNTPHAETFIENISIHQFGNTRGKSFLNNNKHDIQFNR